MLLWADRAERGLGWLWRSGDNRVRGEGVGNQILSWWKKSDGIHDTAASVLQM